MILTLRGYKILKYELQTAFTWQLAITDERCGVLCFVKAFLYYLYIYIYLYYYLINTYSLKHSCGRGIVVLILGENEVQVDPLLKIT